MYTNKTYILYVGIFAFYPCHGLLETVLLNEPLIRGENLVKQLNHLLKRIRYEFPYDYIVIVKDVKKKSACLFEDSIGHLDEPIILLPNLSQQHLLQQQHSNKFILLACSAEYLNQLHIFNTVYQYVPHIIWYQTFEELEMSELCSSINKNGYFQNLIITPQSLAEKETYFNCNLHKHLEIVSRELLANPFLNMQGLPIITESDQLPPRSLLYYNDVGELKLTGFVGNFLTTFAKRYNANLVIVPPVAGGMGVTVFYEILSNKTFQGLLDIAATAIPFKIDTSSETFSYPMELMEYCYMIPLPHIRPAFKLFFEIIELKAMLIILCYFFIYGLLLNIGQHHKITHLNVANILLNDKSMRGMLGQSFVMPKKTSLFMKYICFLLCYTSILICTSYQAYLQSHLVHPPLEKRMETYEDIHRNNYKILIDGRESVFIYPEILEKHHDLFVKEINFDKFLKTRHNMDTRYIYPVSQTRWFVFSERQKLFQRKLFYYSSQLCLSNLVLLSFPLRPGLPYRHQFNQHLLDVRDTGLLDHWLENNFLMMVRLKLSSFKDLSVADEYGEVLLLMDYLWIWILYAACILLSTLVFVGELIFCKVFSK
ncbi:uncharacterized protein LOC135961537 [Calliphora vicina]|uniref:uncharacterized protein LOC135961537 n=1 Tax=Calliphora vicina TaxID=7373 RepID=UPI00325AAD66